MSRQPTIGLEVHVQLATCSKLFSRAATTYGALPNTQASYLDLGLPGTLPTINQAAVAMAIKFGLAIDGTIAKQSEFARKNYFYPDLPKGYQITQYDHPLITHGHLAIYPEGKKKLIAITQAHLEEDAGKLLHDQFNEASGVDFNRAGNPLLEIVSAPVLENTQEALLYLKALYNLVCYLDICDGNMQEGSFRIDTNISVAERSASTLGTRCEIKNLNSFKFVEKAILYEIDRHNQLLDQGIEIAQETRLYDSQKQETRPMRTKEEAKDYRYFPDPDLPVLVISDAFIEKVSATLPELPDAKIQRFQTDYQLTAYQATVLAQDKALAHYFEATMAYQPIAADLVSNWILGDLLALLNKYQLTITQCPITPEALNQLLQRIVDKTISGKIAKEVLVMMWESGHAADRIIKEANLRQISDTEVLEQMIDTVLSEHPQQLADYLAGKSKLLEFFVGQIMKASQGKADPEQVRPLLKARLDLKHSI